MKYIPITFLVAQCAIPPSPIDGPRVIVALGDSITDPSYYRSQGFVPWTAYAESMGTSIVPAGVASRTFIEWSDPELQRRVFPYNPSDVVIICGINDFSIGQSADQVWASMTGLISRLGNRRVWVATVPSAALDTQQEAQRKKFNERLLAVSQSPTFHVIDFAHLFDPSDSGRNASWLVWNPTSVHPNNSGSQILARHIVDAISLIQPL